MHTRCTFLPPSAGKDEAYVIRTRPVHSAREGPAHKQIIARLPSDATKNKALKQYGSKRVHTLPAYQDATMEPQVS